MSNSPASEPPTWRWIVTAVITNAKFFEPTRSAISASAVVHRPAEPRLGQHPLELLARRRPALVDDGLEPLLEAVARLQRRRERDRAGRAAGSRTRSCAACALSADDHERDSAPPAQPEQDQERRTRATTREEQADRERRRRRDVDELDRAEREVGPLEHPLEPLPLRACAREALLGGAEERGRRPQRARRSVACSRRRASPRCGASRRCEPAALARAATERSTASRTSDADARARARACPSVPYGSSVRQASCRGGGVARAVGTADGARRRADAAAAASRARCCSPGRAAVGYSKRHVRRSSAAIGA